MKKYLLLSVCSALFLSAHNNASAARIISFDNQNQSAGGNLVLTSDKSRDSTESGKDASSEKHDLPDADKLKGGDGALPETNAEDSRDKNPDIIKDKQDLSGSNEPKKDAGDLSETKVEDSREVNPDVMEDNRDHSVVNEPKTADAVKDAADKIK